MALPGPKQASSILISITVSLLILFCNSCKKISNNETTDPPYVPTDTSKATIRDLTTKINSSVSGFVTDEFSNAVNGAAVMVGNLNTITDKYGFFEIKNVQVVKEAAVVTVVQPGYFKGIKTYIAKEGKSVFFRIQLIPKNTMGSIDGAAGGNITLTTGLSISIPANAVVNANTNAAYTGQVNIAAKYINPEGNDIRLTMPGDLRGLDSLGSLKLLTTYGMAAVEITGSGGELLQLATGKKAALTFPLSNGLASAAPSTIPLWYFDEANGLWKQQGFAIKSGNNYVGDVSHFSFWNCDGPNNYIHFDCTVVDEKGNPIPGIWVKVSLVSNPVNAGWGLTDSSGYTAGVIPNNSSLLMEVFSTQDCDIPAFSKTFSTSSANVSMGNTIIANQNNATVTGTVTNCNGLPVTNGYIIMIKEATNFRYPISNTGTFNFNTSICQTGNTTVGLIAEDNTSKKAGDLKSFNLTTGDNSIGNVSVCGTSALMPFNCTLVNIAGNALPNVWVKLSDLSHPQNSPIWSLADSSGYISRTLFGNSQFLLEVFATRFCSSPVFSKNFSTSDTTTSLGNISVNGIDMATVSGTVTNCNGDAVSNGSVIMQKDGSSYRYPLSSTGTFSFTTPVCNTTNTAFVSLAAEDNSTLQLGNVIYDTLTAGNNVIGILNTCFTANNSDQEFIILTIDSSNYSFVSPVDSFQYLISNVGTPAEQVYFSAMRLPISSYEENQRINFSTGGIRGSITYLWEFNVRNPNFTVDGRGGVQIPINITEYGDIGQFISGNFKLNVFEDPSSQDPISLKASCSFRIRRRQ